MIRLAVPGSSEGVGLNSGGPFRWGVSCTWLLHAGVWEAVESWTESSSHSPLLGVHPEKEGYI